MSLQAATGTPYGFSRRRYVRTLVARLREEPRWLNVVAGPRQTGKTTLVRHALSEIRRPWIHVLVDEPDPATVQAKSLRRLDPLLSDIASTPVNQRDARWLVRTWEKARFAAETSDRGFVLALDEIQQIADWPRTVKGLWDSDRIHGRPLRVVLLSSAPLLMQRGASESLVGRFEVPLQVLSSTYSTLDSFRRTPVIRLPTRRPNERSGVV